MEIINVKGSNYIVCVCYRHPKKTSDETFNTWLQNSKDNKVTQFLDIMTQFNLQPTINKLTRIVKNQRPSLIDNIYINSLEKIITSGNLVSQISDHMPNFMFMKRPLSKQQ